MGQAFFNELPAARAIFEQADAGLGFSLSQLCFEGPEEALNDTINTQVAIYTTSMAALAALRAAGFTAQPDFVAGHSLGEYSAYAAAGVFSVGDGLRLVRERGRLMKKAGELNPGGMAAFLKLDDDVVAEICQKVTDAGDVGTLQVANYNSPGQIVVSGHSAAVDRGIELALEAKARRAVKLPVSIAAHSELMRVVADEFRQAVDATPLNLPETPIVANISAAPLESVEAIREEMEGQLTNSVYWTASVEWMIGQGVDTFVELGPKDVLAGLIKRVSKQVQVYSINTPQALNGFLSSVNS
ncbi:MAG: Malonyl CoA-acyl carrier protein transacylase [Anaerolineae bacterium]|nr:Malonyl CoA-acyl carrier protein transacylase [Anaerolineae bacterium]